MQTSGYLKFKNNHKRFDNFDDKLDVCYDLLTSDSLSYFEMLPCTSIPSGVDNDSKTLL